MKSLIVYSSKSGNTKKLADVIYETLDGDKEIVQIDKVSSLKGYDKIFIGFWLQAGKPDPKTIELLEKAKGLNVFLFATHGAKAGSEHVKNALNYAVDILGDAQIAGSFTCQGEVNPNVLEKVKQRPEPPLWLADADDAVGHPNEEDFLALRTVVTQS